MKLFISGFLAATVLIASFNAFSYMGAMGYIQGSAASGKANRLERRLDQIERRVSELEKKAATK